jgi:MSHA pilin protein MshD
MIKQKGVTLVELIIAMVIIGIAVSAVLSVYKTSVINSATPMVKKQAMLIAESLMDEVLNKSFIKPSGGFSGPYTIANRDQFDTVSDYNNFSMSGIYNVSGIAISELSKYSANITVSNTALSSIPATDSILVSITVSAVNNSVTLNGYRINYEQ